MLPDLIISIVKNVPDIYTIPNLTQMQLNTQKTLDMFGDLVETIQVGISTSGIPIEMISIGNGPKSALFIGAPHPNEPIGCLVIEHLINSLCEDKNFRDALPYRCHFIKTIEPDAIQLNQEWFNSPGDLSSYLKNFYRPAIFEQAEHTFPFSDEDFLSQNPLPENLAWRKAIELTQPDFMYSLHNAEFGGVFYLSSGMTQKLSKDLKFICQEYGQTINPYGEPELEKDQWEPGLYKFPQRKRTEPPLSDSIKRSIGNTSAGYTANLGTFSFVAEVPYWYHDKLKDKSLSSHTIESLENELHQWSIENNILMLANKSLSLPYPDASAEINGLQYALLDFKDYFENEKIAAICNSEEKKPLLSQAEYLIRNITGRLLRLRFIAMVRRLSSLSSDKPSGNQIAAKCSRILEEQVKILNETDQIKSNPLRQLVQLQLHAGLNAMFIYQ